MARHVAKAKAALMDTQPRPRQLPRLGHVAKGKVAPMGTQTRPGHATLFLFNQINISEQLLKEKPVQKPNLPCLTVCNSIYHATIGIK